MRKYKHHNTVSEFRKSWQVKTESGRKNKSALMNPNLKMLGIKTFCDTKKTGSALQLVRQSGEVKETKILMNV